MEKTVQALYYSGDILLKNPHFHDCHQIILILRGQVEFCVNGTSLHAGAGDIAVFSRYENHSVRVKSAQYERYVLQIHPNVTRQKNQVYALLTDRPHGFSNVISVNSDMEHLLLLFRQLMAEQSAGHPLADEMEELLVKQLLITVYRCAGLHFDRLRDEIVQDIKRNFENRFQEPYTLDSLAKQYSISTSSLSHRFLRITGVSVMAYLQSCRMAQAKRLLADTQLPVGEIVALCGFSDNSNFSRTFKELNGLSPSAFRRQFQ